MTSKHMDLGLLELLGNNVLLLLLPAGLSPGTPNIARRVTLPSMGLENSEKDKWTSRETKGKDEGGIHCHHGPLFWGTQKHFLLGVYSEQVLGIGKTEFDERDLQSISV